MGAFLFYIIKSAFCLGVFYILFRVIMSRSTFFRFNRLTLLVGMFGCMLLPLVEVTTEKENLLNTPFQVVERALTEVIPFELVPVNEANGWAKEEGQALIAGLSETAVRKVEMPVSKNWIISGAGLIYIVGASLTLIVFVISTIRMFRLILKAEKHTFGNYILALLDQPLGSFSWGKYIVMSKSDYACHPDEVLLHETMHLRSLHTLDLFGMQCFLIVQWFNPAVWLLRRELQEIHEYEADNKVINTGIDATRYQLLLVKKAVGTRLYSMANGFNHSKLKNRITMMLKERTNGWARLKLLLFVPVVAGTLYAFASPDVSETLLQEKPEISQESQEQPMDYQTLMAFLKQESDAAVIRRFGGLDVPITIKERQVHKLLMNARNQLLFDGEAIKKENLKAAIVKALPDNQQKMLEKDGKKYDQIITFQCDRGTNTEEARQVLEIAKDAFVEIRNNIAATSADKSKEYLDDVFPIYIVEIERKNIKQNPTYGLNDKINGIQLDLVYPDGTSIKLDGFTLAELHDQLNIYRKKFESSDNNLKVSMKIDKDCNMGTVDVVKKSLRTFFKNEIIPGTK